MIERSAKSECPVRKFARRYRDLIAIIEAHYGAACSEKTTCPAGARAKSIFTEVMQ